MPREVGRLGRQLHGQPVRCRQLVRQHAFQAVAGLDCPATIKVRTERQSGVLGQFW